MFSDKFLDSLVDYLKEHPERIRNPDYIIPCHCKGRKAIMEFEKAMPDKFILNMSGTRMDFVS